jgi:ankyrin repeat protein
LACANGHIYIAKWLIQDHQVDNDSAFRWACMKGHIELAKWLVQDH